MRREHGAWLNRSRMRLCECCITDSMPGVRQRTEKPSAFCTVPASPSCSANLSTLISLVVGRMPSSRKRPPSSALMTDDFPARK